MNLKRGLFPGVLFFLIVFLIQFSSAINLTITPQPIVDTIINNHDIPAIFEFTVTNNQDSGDFEIYIFERFEISVEEFSLSKGETETFRIEFLPIDSMRENDGHVFVPVFFRVKDSAETQEAEIDVEVISFESAFSVGAESVTLNSEFAKVNFYNLENIEYENIEVIFSSSFFDDYQREFALEPYEKKSFEIPLNDKLKELVFGDYEISAKLRLNEKEITIKGIVRIVEKTGLSFIEDKKGIFIRKTILEKINQGNVPMVADISLKKNIISRLFTTFSVEPQKIERNGIFVTYSWQRELSPSQSLEVTATTNWIFPFLLVLAIVVIVFLINKYYTQHLVVKKSVSFMKTKSGDFALKVRIKIRAKKFMEKVSVYDRLPAMAKLYKQYGQEPTEIEENTGRLRWDFPHLAQGEERILNYLFYSKLKVIGKFELPSATGIYEIQGKINKAKSNKVFFINEPEERKRKIEEDF